MSRIAQGIVQQAHQADASTKARMVEAIAGALRLAEGYRASSSQSWRWYPWIWLGQLTHVYQNLVASFGVAPWGTHDVSPATAQAWEWIVASYAVELDNMPQGWGSPEGVYPPSAYASPERLPGWLQSMRAQAATVVGLPENATATEWTETASQLESEPPAFPQNTETWRPWSWGWAAYDLSDKPLDDPESLYPIDPATPYADPRWCERQSWAAVCALIGAATDLGSFSQANITGSSSKQSEPSGGAHTIAAVVVGTGVALAIAWALLG